MMAATVVDEQFPQVGVKCCGGYPAANSIDMTLADAEEPRC
jgi:hypothetical protein